MAMANCPWCASSGGGPLDGGSGSSLGSFGIADLIKICEACVAAGSAPRRRGAVWAVVTGIHAFKVRWLLAYFGYGVLQGIPVIVAKRYAQTYACVWVPGGRRTSTSCQGARGGEEVPCGSGQQGKKGAAASKAAAEAEEPLPGSVQAGDCEEAARAHSLPTPWQNRSS